MRMIVHSSPSRGPGLLMIAAGILTLPTSCSRATYSALWRPSASRPSLFFFQAEGGIRYLYVTGVQTCALPIFLDLPDPLAGDVERPPHLVERPRMLAVE